MRSTWLLWLYHGIGLPANVGLKKIFKLVGEGRLKLGWNDTIMIKDLQQDTCTEAVRAMQARAARFQPETIKQQATQPSKSTSPVAINPPPNTREDYNKVVDGKPCYRWNWGKDWGFQGSHGSAPDNLLHVCAWCAYKFKRQLVHKEQDCLKKCRFLDKKASASTTTTASVSVSHFIDQLDDKCIPPAYSDIIIIIRFVQLMLYLIFQYVTLVHL